jgi:hypothetical protein
MDADLRGGPRAWGLRELPAEDNYDVMRTIEQ